MNTKIFTMTHRKFDAPEDQIYIPLHVGRALTEDLGYLGDDTGESISASNPYYGELTGVYWVWKNIQDADIIGICHYRRFFLNKDRELMNQQEYEAVLKDYDIMVSNKAQAEECYQNYYAQAHNVEDLFMVGKVIDEKYPDYSPYFASALAQKDYYYGNLMVTSRTLFAEYAKWLFTILFEVEQRIDVSSYDLYNRRVFGFLSEQMLKVWIDKNKLRVYEGMIGILAEKAETVELKLAMKQLVKMGEYTQATQMFYEYIKLRPDVSLELSDIRGEIPMIEQLLYIAVTEQQQGITGLAAYSNDLNEWIKHFCRVRDCLAHFSIGKIGKADEQYITKNQVSWIMGKVILINASKETIPDSSRALQALYDVYQKNGNMQACRGLEQG